LCVQNVLCKLGASWWKEKVQHAWLAFQVFAWQGNLALAIYCSVITMPVSAGGLQGDACQLICLTGSRFKLATSWFVVLNCPEGS
jgi:hypothetical protein